MVWQNLKYAARRGMILRRVNGRIQNIPVEYADESESEDEADEDEDSVKDEAMRMMIL